MMRCFVSLVLPRPQSNVNMRPERIAIPSALSLLLFRTSIFNNKSKTVWYSCICMVCCDCKKSFCALQNEAEGVGDDREWSEPIHIIGHFLALALLNRGLNKSWFKEKFYDHTIPKDLFRKQLRICKNTGYPCWAHSCASIMALK